MKFFFAQTCNKKKERKQTEKNISRVSHLFSPPLSLLLLLLLEVRQGLIVPQHDILHF